MNDYGRFFGILVLTCIIIGALFVGLLWFFWPPDKPDPEYSKRVEMCRWYTYDSTGVKIDSGYFPVTFLEKQK